MSILNDKTCFSKIKANIRRQHIQANLFVFLRLFINSKETI